MGKVMCRWNRVDFSVGGNVCQWAGWIVLLPVPHKVPPPLLHTMVLNTMVLFDHWLYLYYIPVKLVHCR